MEKTSGDSSYQYVSLTNKNQLTQVRPLKDVVDVNENCFADGTKICIKGIDRLIEENDHTRIL